MTNRFLVSVAAVALIAGASAANAQGGTDHEGGAAMQQKSPSGGSTGGAMQKGTEPSSGMKPTQSEQHKLPGAAQSQHAEEPSQKSKTQSTESETKGAIKGQRAEEPGQKSKTQSTESETKGGAKAQRSEELGQKSKSLSTESETKGAKDNMKAEGHEGRDSNTNAQRIDERSQTTTGQAGAAAKLSTEQRTQITTVIRSEHVAPVNSVDFSISVGTRVPRERISLRPLPARVITIYPEWRGYEFFLVRDTIVVVDPRTLEIVAVLPA